MYSMAFLSLLVRSVTYSMGEGNVGVGTEHVIFAGMRASLPCITKYGVSPVVAWTLVL